MSDREDVLGLNARMGGPYRILYRDLAPPWLYERILDNREGHIAHRGPVVVGTGDCSEMPLENKYVVRPPDGEGGPHWLDAYQALPAEWVDRLFSRLRSSLLNKETFVQHAVVGRDPENRLTVRFVTETAWHSLFVRNLYGPVADPGQDPDAQGPDFTVVHIPGFRADPVRDGVRAPSFVLVDPAAKLIVIGGTCYAGEIRQAVFTLINMAFPPDRVLCMRCAANVGPEGDVAVFLGRKKTGKTTLAVDPERRLLGDQYHGWPPRGLSSCERGIYARVLDLSVEEQPEIHACTRMFGTLLENVSLDPGTRRVDLSDRSLTENARAVFPVSHLANHVPEGVAGHPRHLFLLSCDALGVLPPIARLTPEMAVYGILSGYTSDLSRQEQGAAHLDIGFSTCFGVSAITRPAHVIGRALMEKIREHGVTCWLVNTGWAGEPQGRGERIPLPLTRALVRGAVSGALDRVETVTDPLFRYEIPAACPGVPPAQLNPRKAAADEGEYELRANRLVREFIRDFDQHAGKMPEGMREMLSGVLTLDDRFDVLEAFDISM